MILKGDCIEVMKALKPNSMDAIVCDPPYGLEFMGKEWDKLWNNRKSGGFKFNPSSKNKSETKSSFGAIYKAGLQAQLWHTQWLTEAYRVLKPGGSMLVMGGTRTSHRLACAIEDSGFIIKDTLMWIYGSGFPKAQDLGKMIDKRMGKLNIQSQGFSFAGDDGRKAKLKQTKKYRSDYGYQYNPDADLAKHWDGFKIGGIKPAYEPIIWAVKPPEGSYVDNVLKWGVGAVNVDECRIGINNGDDIHAKNPHTKGGFGHADSRVFGKSKNSIQYEVKGRFPANVILSHHPECVQVGMKRVKNKGGVPDRDTVKNSKPAFTSKEHTSTIHHFEKGGSEIVESWDCHPDCAVRMLDEQSGVLRGSHGTTGTGRGHSSGNIYPKKLGGVVGVNYPDTNSSGASRFFYCAKASRSERNSGLKGITCTHPTVKPIKLFEWLIKLVTREGQIILDPFIGSGTTAIAAYNVGRKCVGIEKEDEYLEIAKRRIRHWENKPEQMELR